MHPDIAEAIHTVVRESGLAPATALEVGGVTGPDSLLNAPELRAADRYCLNLEPMPPAEGITVVTGSANDMHMFGDGSFDVVLCNATLEHDRHFWLTLAEMKRVLRPGGLLVVGVPGFVRNAPGDESIATSTYRVHYTVDYYRFSKQAVRQVFLAGMRQVGVAALLEPPRIIGHGRKPVPRPRPQPSLRKRARRRVRRAVRAGLEVTGVRRSP